MQFSSMQFLLLQELFAFSFQDQNNGKILFYHKRKFNGDMVF